jgi:hypothetical protein
MTKLMFRERLGSGNRCGKTPNCLSRWPQPKNQFHRSPHRTVSDERRRNKPFQHYGASAAPLAPKLMRGRK